MAWEKSSTTANWWFFFKGKAIGYLPASLYTHGMQTKATNVQFGGEVYSPDAPGTKHTSTQMGSGDFPSKGCGYAAFQSHVQYIDADYNTVDVNPFGVEDTNTGCYNYSTGYETASTCSTGTQSTFQNGFFEFFGGPGYSASKCPTVPPGD
jgi:hypothetical protein